MRGRAAVACVLAVMAVGAGAAGADAAKAPLWLVEIPGTNLRAAEGAPVELGFEAEGTCETFQEGVLASNGKPRDEIGAIGSPVRTLECRSGVKVAGALTAISMTPAGSEAMTISVKDTLHVFVEPWCVYTVPKKLNFTMQASTRAAATFSSALDKAASFGACAAKRPVEVSVSVVLKSDDEPLYREPAE